MIYLDKIETFAEIKSEKRSEFAKINTWNNHNFAKDRINSCFVWNEFLFVCLENEIICLVPNLIFENVKVILICSNKQSKTDVTNYQFLENTATLGSRNNQISNFNLIESLTIINNQIMFYDKINHVNHIKISGTIFE